MPGGPGLRGRWGCAVRDGAGVAQPKHAEAKQTTINVYSFFCLSVFGLILNHMPTQRGVIRQRHAVL